MSAGVGTVASLTSSAFVLSLLMNFTTIKMVNQQLENREWFRQTSHNPKTLDWWFLWRFLE